MDDCQLCPKFEFIFKLLGKRWTGMIIRVMLSGKRRFSDISSMIPDLSDNMLAARLKELEMAGIVERNVYWRSPVRVEYKLTERGRELEPAMDKLQEWANKWVGK